ncbi:MAG: 50S ribosomal protein L11 methyltransferase [Rickettsiales bacterium]|nr:50S ribosomal protein L11 methyltransferase [Rickettsiales bacterium]
MTVRNKTNPFAQPNFYWKVSFKIPAAGAGMAEEAFGGLAMAVSGFETDEANHIWTFDLLCEEEPNLVEIKTRLILLCGMCKVAMPEVTVEKLQQQDWLSQVAQNFPPLSIGRFFVHGAHIVPPSQSSIIPIQVDAGAAFGSGEHGTTRCCLGAMDWLTRSRRFNRILDMGCGSGILGIAAAKLWKMPVLAVDIDDVAVRVTQENVRMNRVTQWVDAQVSDGYASERVKRSGPYDLILSNILARPLVEFAPHLKRHLAPGGVAVLSGLLVSQETMVRAAHMSQGLKLVRRFTHGEWCTLVLE